jgi:hypothetical protein
VALEGRMQALMEKEPGLGVCIDKRFAGIAAAPSDRDLTCLSHTSHDPYLPHLEGTSKLAIQGR